MTTTKAWHQSMTPGTYISADGRYTATLRPAGYYPEVGAKLTRHYAIRASGHEQIIDMPRTLKEAARRYAPEATR